MKVESWQGINGKLLHDDQKAIVVDDDQKLTELKQLQAILDQDGQPIDEVRQAKIVIDRFHIVAMMTRAFNQTRVQTMKKYNKRSYEYRTLKFAWRLYLKYAGNLDEEHVFYDRHLRKQLTQLERVEQGLTINEELKASWRSM